LVLGGAGVAYALWKLWKNSDSKTPDKNKRTPK